MYYCVCGERSTGFSWFQTVTLLMYQSSAIVLRPFIHPSSHLPEHWQTIGLCERASSNHKQTACSLSGIFVSRVQLSAHHFEFRLLPNSFILLSVSDCSCRDEVSGFSPRSINQLVAFCLSTSLLRHTLSTHRGHRLLSSDNVPLVTHPTLPQ